MNVVTAKTTTRLALVTAVVTLVSAYAASASNVVYAPGGQPSHWSDRGGSTPVVYVRDHTGAGWPVNASSIDWNKNGPLTVTYQFLGSCSFHCMDVRVVDELGACGNPYGRTVLNWSTLGHMTSTTRVQLNTRCIGLSGAQKRNITCHELGHATGSVNHQANNCMLSYVPSPPNQYPGAHDYNMFQDPIYNHND